MYDKMTMSGRARGYKQAGKKLLPRDAGDLQVPGRNQRERNRYVVAELKHNKEVHEHFVGGMSPLEKRVLLSRKALSARRAKRVEVFIEDMVASDHKEPMYEAALLMFGSAQWRYFSALHDEYEAAMMEAVDEKLLSYARG